ncbi:MAG: hypothetical protein ACTSVI_16740 [Promethearchaeota archaeon]
MHFSAVEGGRYILAPCSNVIGCSKIENFVAINEIAIKHSTYPINFSP